MAAPTALDQAMDAAIAAAGPPPSLAQPDPAEWLAVFPDGRTDTPPIRFRPERRDGRWAIVMTYQSHLALTAAGGRAVQLADGDWPTRKAAQDACDQISVLVAEHQGQL